MIGGVLMLAAAAAIVATAIVADVWLLGLPAVIAAAALSIGGVEHVRHARRVRDAQRARAARRGYLHR